MILRRLGNKKLIAKKVQAFFPHHKLYIEPFFGAGGMFFNKPKAEFNILNDLDSDVYNLFKVLLNKKDELLGRWNQIIIHEDLWNHWKSNQESTDIMKAVRFLVLSNFGYMGKPDTLRYFSRNTSKMISRHIDSTYQFIRSGCEFMNTDFRNVLSRISLNDQEKERAFCYADPPYLDTDNNYQQGFTKQDCVDLLDVLQASGMKFIMSEFDHPFVVEQARIRSLHIQKVGYRANLKNRRLELLVMNYIPHQLDLFS